jgi:N-methylhydantoinase B
MQRMKAMDPVTLEIINNRLRFISKEMVITLTRTAYSSVIYDGHDCSAGIFDAKGQLLTLDAGIPFHISAMPFSVRAVLQQFEADIHAGDLFITNDPSSGGTHLPDMLIIMPVFHADRLVFFAAARGHWTDVGGSTPGSLSGKASELIQEGLVIPPIKLFERGKLNQPLANLLFSNMRMRDVRFGDMMSQTAACRHAEKACLELIQKYGVDTAEQCGEEIISRTEKNLRRKLRTLPQGMHYYEDYLDNDGFSREARRIKVAIVAQEGSLSIDFTGSSRQSKGPLNCTVSTTHGAVAIAAKIILDPTGVPNEGLFRLIKINAPMGSMLNPNPGAPTGGFTEVGYRVVYCIIGALASSLPNQVSGCDYGTVNHTYISGNDDATGHSFIHYEYPPGGNGGCHSMDGPNGMRGPISGNTSMQSNELVESLNPLRSSYATLRADSGGPGKFRGGLGLVRRVEILSKEAFLSTVTDRSAIPPFGVYGGLSGRGQEWSVIRNGVQRLLPYDGKVSRFKLKKGDIVSSLTAGGGGYGDPLERNAEAVQRDVVEGYISKESCRNVYGVVLKAKDLRVDRTATRKQRQTLREGGRTFTALSCGDPVFIRGIKGIVLNRTEAAGLRPGDLVEIYHEPCAVAYRRRIILQSRVKSKHALLDNETLQMMDLKEGSAVRVRKVFG